MKKLSFRPVGMTFRKDNFIQITEGEVEVRHTPLTADGKNYPNCLTFFFNGKDIAVVKESVEEFSAMEVMQALIRDGIHFSVRIESVIYASQDCVLGKEQFYEGEPCSCYMVLEFENDNAYKCNDKPTVKDYLHAANMGCSFIEHPSDTKQGFTRTKVSKDWEKKLEASRSFIEAYKEIEKQWQTDCYDSGWQELESGYKKLMETTISFSK